MSVANFARIVQENSDLVLRTPAVPFILDAVGQQTGRKPPVPTAFYRVASMNEVVLRAGFIPTKMNQIAEIPRIGIPEATLETVIRTIGRPTLLKALDAAPIEHGEPAMYNPRDFSESIGSFTEQELIDLGQEVKNELYRRDRAAS
jgi:hypothetical protein